MLFRQGKRHKFSLGKNILAFCAASAMSAQLCGAALADTSFLGTATTAGAATKAGINASMGIGSDMAYGTRTNTADGTISFREGGNLSHQLDMPVYEWQKQGVKPRGIVLTVHGLAMHGKCYSTFGRKLAEQGFIVVSTDLRGYGKYQSAGHQFCKATADCKEKTNYDRSFHDIARLAHALRERYPSLPLFGVGESLGGAMIIRLAADNPELVDGLVLSAPAIRHHSFVDPYVVADASLCMTNPRHQLDLTPFVRRYSSDDPRIVQEVLEDPLARRHLSFYELLQASNTVHKTASYISKIPVDTPVLVIQGSADRCVKANSVMILLSELRSNDQTVKWFHERGHILIETAFIKPDTMEAITVWLDSHASSTAVQAKCDRDRDVILGQSGRSAAMSIPNVTAESADQATNSRINDARSGAEVDEGGVPLTYIPKLPLTDQTE